MKPNRLTITERERISELYLQKTMLQQISDKLYMGINTVRNELKLGYTGNLDKNGYPEYDPQLAQQRNDEARRQNALKRKKEPKVKPPPKVRRINEDDRELISKLYLQLYTNGEIAEKTGFHVSTIMRELKLGYTGNLDKNELPEYDPKFAQQKVGKKAE